MKLFFFFLYDFVSYISLSFSQFAISSRSPKKGSWWPTIKRWNYTDVDSSIWNTHTGRILSNSSVCFYSFKNKEPHFYRLVLPDKLDVTICNRPKVASLKCVEVYKLFYKPLRLKKIQSLLPVKYNTSNLIIMELCYLEVIYIQESIPHWINFHSHKKSRASRSWAADSQQVLSTFQQTQLAEVLCIARLKRGKIKEEGRERKQKKKNFALIIKYIK